MNYCVMVLIMSFAVSVPLHAQILQSQAQAETPHDSETSAMLDLNQYIHDELAVNHVGTSPIFDHATAKRLLFTRALLPIEGVDRKQQKRRDFLKTTLQFDIQKNLGVYKKKLNNLRREIQQNQNKELRTDLDLLDQYYRYALVASLADNNILPLSVNESELKERFANTSKGFNSIESVVQKIAAELKSKVCKKVFVYPPTFGESIEISLFSSSVGELLAENFTAVSQPHLADCFLEGEYANFGQKTVLSYHLLDKKNILITKSMYFVLQKNQNSEVNNDNTQFSRILYRGLSRVTNKSHLVKSRKLKSIIPQLQVNLKTDKGQRSIHYRVGESGKLYVKLSAPGYFYIVAHLNKASATYSYLFQLNTKTGNDKFISRVSQDDVNRWIELGEFDVSAPIGMESLQIIAQAKNPLNLLPASTYDEDLELYIVDKDPKQAVKKTRGLLRVIENKPLKNNTNDVDSVSMQTTVSESILEFTTLPRK